MKKILFGILIPVLFATFSCENNRHSEPGTVRNDTIKDAQYYVNKENTDSLAPSNTSMHESCIDPTKIDTNATCIESFDPVCGCDNKTYSNSCKADKAGVTNYVKGECKK